jgi:hypothetical protein
MLRQQRQGDPLDFVASQFIGKFQVIERLKKIQGGEAIEEDIQF